MNLVTFWNDAGDSFMTLHFGNSKQFLKIMKLSSCEVDSESFKWIGNTPHFDLYSGRYEFLKLSLVSGVSN